MILLSETDRHPKVIKNGKMGISSSILHLAPATMSGHEVCPMRSKGCTKACLNYAGFQYQRKYDARVKRTQWFFEDQLDFMIRLTHEISVAECRARRMNFECGIRLNGTSDIRWEEIPANNPAISPFKNIMQIFPDVKFMDYTKQPDRKNLPPNYRLTFSRSESNHAHCIEALNNGMNVAAVFLDLLPATAQIGGKTYRVIDGDLHDWRYGDYDDFPERVIVGLRAKGPKAKGDTSGFVIAA